MKLLYGKSLADEKLKRVKERVSQCKKEPGIAAILVGENEASKMYVELKKKAAKKSGMLFCDYLLPENSQQDEVLEVIDHLNHDHEIDGILVQLPLPEHINRDSVINEINPDKDVDGLTRENQKKFLDGEESYWCPFPKAIESLLDVALRDKATDLEKVRLSAVILTRSDGFGKMLEKVLKDKNIEAKPIQVNERENYHDILLQSDIIISALGIPGFVRSEDIKEGAIVIDGGIERVGEGVVGDVVSSNISEKEGVLTPVPGGVGPMTVACLIENVLLAAKNHGKC